MKMPTINIILGGQPQPSDKKEDTTESPLLNMLRGNHADQMGMMTQMADIMSRLQKELRTLPRTAHAGGG